MSPQKILSKTILNKTKRRDPWFLDDYTINPYSGCSYNCLFCYIRGSKYGEHMERSMAVKENAIELNFNSTLYFLKIFKEKTGFNPTEYRMRARGCLKGIGVAAFQA